MYPLEIMVCDGSALFLSREPLGAFLSQSGEDLLRVVIITLISLTWPI